jgi:hypothetical protein
MASSVYVRARSAASAKYSVSSVPSVSMGWTVKGWMGRINRFARAGVNYKRA